MIYKKNSEHTGRFGARSWIALPILTLSIFIVGTIQPIGAANLLLDGTDGDTSNDAGTINGIIFNTGGVEGKISNLDSFLELEVTGGQDVEGGHNSSVAPGNDEKSFSGIQLRDVPLLGVNNQPHFQFFIDVNEPGGTPGIRITKLEFFTSPIDGATYIDGDPPTSPFDAISVNLGAIVTRLDAGGDNTVSIANVAPGLNDADIEILVPIAAFAGRSADDYLYVYTVVRDVGAGVERFGVNDGATTFYTGDTIVPEPSASLFALLAVAGLLAKRRRCY